MNAETDPETFPAYIVPDPFSGDPDFRPGAVWWEARQDYLKGDSAPTVCARYELCLSTFRTRARKEGWRRCDQEERQADLSLPRELDPAPPTPELVDQAWRAMADALKRGRASEAKSFMRLVHDLRAEVSREEALVQHQLWLASRAEAEVARSHSDATSFPSSSGSTREPSTPQGVVERTTLGSPEGRCPPTPRETGVEADVREDTATPDPELHGLHCDSDSATAAVELAAMDDALAAECDRLQARARSGRASKPELLVLQAKRNQLRASLKARDAFHKAERMFERLGPSGG